MGGHTPPIKVGILETPTGFEVNAMHGWPERMNEFFTKHLKNWHPEIIRIRAWRKDGAESTNNPDIVDDIRTCDYLYSGAGSPTYTITHLQNSLAWERIISAHSEGTTLCFGSATAVACSSYAIPVYEIYKVGEDLRWVRGLNFFEQYGMSVAIVPHWNNTEGEDFDTTRCWMGEKRFGDLKKLLPESVTIIGIDETTALIIDPNTDRAQVSGTGAVHIFTHDKEHVLKNGDTVELSLLRG